MKRMLLTLPLILFAAGCATPSGSYYVGYGDDSDYQADPDLSYQNGSYYQNDYYQGPAYYPYPAYSDGFYDHGDDDGSAARNDRGDYDHDDRGHSDRDDEHGYNVNLDDHDDHDGRGNHG